MSSLCHDYSHNIPLCHILVNRHTTLLTTAYNHICFSFFYFPPLYYLLRNCIWNIIDSTTSLIRQRHSYSRLLLTRQLFDTLMANFKIVPRFKEFVLLFGARIAENEIGPPSFRSRTFSPQNALYGGQCSAGFGKETDLRFGALLMSSECAYGLRYAELNHRDIQRPWSVRQTALYHRYDADKKSSTWVMIAPSQKVELRIERYIKSCDDVANHSPFEFHIIILDTVLANWRPFIIHLTESITKQVGSFFTPWPYFRFSSQPIQSESVIVASIDNRDELQLLEVEERRRLKDLEDQVIDVLLIMDLCQLH